jgi:hypothetical protein
MPSASFFVNRLNAKEIAHNDDCRDHCNAQSNVHNQVLFFAVHLFVVYTGHFSDFHHLFPPKFQVILG